MKKLFLFGAVALLMIIFQTSCSMGDNGGSTNPEQGSFLMANVSPDAPSLNIYVNNSPLSQGFSFGTYTPYYSAVAGVYALSFTNASNATVLGNSINVEANKAYSYILVDSFNTIKSTFFEDNLIVPGSDSVYIRFFNFSPNSPLLNLRDSATGQVLYSQRSFNDQATNSSKTAFMRILAGNYTFQLQNLDLDSSIVVSKAYTLTGGHIYTLFAKGFVGGIGTQAIGVGQIQNF